jgi:hypothetical protein
MTIKEERIRDIIRRTLKSLKAELSDVEMQQIIDEILQEDHNTPRLLVITYDSTEVDYDNRGSIKELLTKNLEKDQLSKVVFSGTDSVIFFETSIENPMDFYQKIFDKIKYDMLEKFKYTLSLIDKSDNGEHIHYPLQKN